MSDIYMQMIQKAAADLAAMQKRIQGRCDCVVWAIPTFGSENGQIVILPADVELDTACYKRPPGYMPRVIRPSDNGASTHISWRTVPYDAQFGILYHALRREPILPALPSTVGRVA